MKIHIDELEMPKKYEHTCPMCRGRGRGKKAVVNREYEIPDVAGYNYCNTILYIDRRLPGEMAGIPVDKFLEVHEEVEKALQDKLGFSYNHAHMIAEAAEQCAVELAGYDYKKYDREMKKWIKKLLNTAKDVPNDLQPPSTIKGE